MDTVIDLTSLIDRQGKYEGRQRILWTLDGGVELVNEELRENMAMIDRAPRVTLVIVTGDGGDIDEGEYLVLLTDMTHPLFLEGDILLIKECLEDNIPGTIELPEEGETEVTLRRDGEWEGPYFRAYYNLESYKALEEDD